MAVLQQVKAKWQEAINLLEAIPESVSVSAEAKEKLTTYRNNYTAISKKIETEEGLEQLRPEAIAVVNQFAAIHSRLSVGMSYRDYASEVRDLKVAIDRFAQQPEASVHPIYESNTCV